MSKSRVGMVEDATREPEVKETQTTGEKPAIEERAARNIMFTFRLPKAELEALERAAAEAGVPISEYLRQAAALHPSSTVLVRPQYSLSVNTPYAQSGDIMTWSDTSVTTSEVMTTESRRA